jgi:hypothetical protein
MVAIAEIDARREFAAFGSRSFAPVCRADHIMSGENMTLAQEES